jgi:hypothetical protein
MADQDHVIIHGRFSGTGRTRNWIAAESSGWPIRVLTERRDVLQDEATEAESQSGLPMFETNFSG